MYEIVWILFNTLTEINIDPKKKKKNYLLIFFLNILKYLSFY